MHVIVLFREIVSVFKEKTHHCALKVNIKRKGSLLYAAGLVMSGFLLDGCFCLYEVYRTLEIMSVSTPFRGEVKSSLCGVWSMKLPTILNLSVRYQLPFQVTQHVRKCEWNDAPAHYIVSTGLPYTRSFEVEP